jgi:hypothetical protein
MAVIPNTLTTGTLRGQREDLSEVIEHIDPHDTPFYSNAKKGTQLAVRHDWTVQELADAVADNAKAEGDDISAFEATTPATLLSNYAQIARKDVVISGTAEAVRKAGRLSEIAYQMTLKGKELKNDIEKSLVANQAYVTTGARRLAGFPTYVTGANVSLGAGGTPNLAAGTGADAHTYGTTARALTLNMLNGVLKACYNEGGNPDVLMMSPTQKLKFDAIASAGNMVNNQVNMTEHKAASVVGTVSVYLSAFGTHSVTMNRFMDDDVVFAITKRHYEVLALPGRNMTREKLSKTGDNLKEQIIWEGTLKVNAPKAHGVLAALSTT